MLPKLPTTYLRILLFGFILGASLLMPRLSLAQINGHPTVFLNQSYTYNFTEVTSNPLECYSWAISPPSNGSVEEDLGSTHSYNSTTGLHTTTYNAIIKFTSLSGATVQVKCHSTVVASSTPTVVDGRLQPPNGFDIDYGCGITKVTKNALPAEGVQWWWQNASDGESTSLGQVTAGNNSISFIQQTNLYLRPRLTGSGQWGTAAAVNGGTVSVYYTSSVAAPTVANNNAAFYNNSVTISVGLVTDALNYRWYREDGSIVEGLSANTYTATFAKTQTFMVAAVRGCESVTRLPVTVTVYQPPKIFVVGGGSADVSGGSITLTTGSYNGYSWKKNDVLQGTNPTLPVSASGKYTVQVTKNGVVGSGTSEPFSVGTTLDRNFIITNTVLQEGVTDPNSVNGLAIGSKSQTTEYFDGLGRPLQTIVTQGSPNKKDIVHPFVYDEFGRDQKKFLPYSTNETNGLFKTDPIGEGLGSYQSAPQYLFYQNADKIGHDAKPYQEIRYENSPLSRVLKQGGAGAAWQPSVNINVLDDKSIKKKYEVNEATEILKFSYSISTGMLGLPPSSSSDRYYGPNKLTKTSTFDENNNEVVEFFDVEGRLICKNVQYDKVNNVSLYMSTYYIYDDFGNLAMVLPPEGVKEILASAY